MGTGFGKWYRNLWACFSFGNLTKIWWQVLHRLNKERSHVSLHGLNWFFVFQVLVMPLFRYGWSWTNSNTLLLIFKLGLQGQIFERNCRIWLGKIMHFGHPTISQIIGWRINSKVWQPHYNEKDRDGYVWLKTKEWWYHMCYTQKYKDKHKFKWGKLVDDCLIYHHHHRIHYIHELK